MDGWNPTEFSRKEIQRVIDLIPQSDPRTIEYSQVLLSLEQIMAMAGNIDALIRENGFCGGEGQESGEKCGAPGIIEFPKKADPAPVMEEITESDKFDDPTPTDSTEPEEDPVDDGVAYDAVAIKNALGRAKKDNVIPALADWITENFGVKGFNNIPPEQYGKVVKLLKDLGVEV